MDNSYNFHQINNMEDIATKMRMLAAYIGGDHVTNKEAETELYKLADALSIYITHIFTVNRDYDKVLKDITGRKK